MSTRAPRETARLYLVLAPHSVPAKAAPRPTGDERVNRAIALMEGELARRWTVTALARAVGLSRPAFARRFAAATGTSPLRYLASMRMERARKLLAESDDGLARVASFVGYDSEFAFNRAFKRWLGMAPGTYRRELRSTAPVFRAAA